MANKPTRMLLIAAAITSINLYLAPAFAATPGTWTGIAEFGTFELVVTSGGTAIEKISYSFSDWTCGPVTMNGGVGITPGTPWPIVNDEFSLTTSLDPDKTITVSGAFNSASHASGDWDAVIHGVDCSGPWDTSGENEIEIELTVDHAYVKGVYVNPDELPSWGFFADVQEENFFGAIYGYLNGDSTFITLQGTMTSNDPPRFQGNVYFISDNGMAAADVGNFTWTAGDHEAAPAALLTLSSNILNVTNLGLARFSYAEIDKVDMLTGGDWNITRRVADSTFGDQYAIDDTRMVEEGITYAGVVDNWNPDLEGLVGYFPDPGGDFYGMLVEFDDDSNVFYIFIGNDTDLYGRYWLLEADEEPTGGGNHFRAAADSMQVPDTRSSANGAKSHSAVEKTEYKNAGGNLEPMFTKSRIQSAYQNLRRINQQ
jgi:hypothetical protein